MKYIFKRKLDFSSSVLVVLRVSYDKADKCVIYLMNLYVYEILL